MRLISILVFFPFLIQAQSTSFNNDFKKEYDSIISLYQENDLQKALDICNRIISKDKRQQTAWEYKGFIHSRRNEYEQAANSYKYLTVLDPVEAAYWGNAGWYYVLSGQYDTAVIFCNKAIGLQSENYSHYLNLAHAFLLKNEISQAEYWYNVASELVPNEEALNSGPLADFHLLDSLFHSPYFASVNNLFISDFQLAKNNTVSNKLLDSIWQVSTGNSEEKKEIVFELKKKFIDAQANEEIKRYRVLSMFCFDVGLIELNNRNRTIAVKDYIKTAMMISKTLRDSLRLFNMMIFLSQNLLDILKADNQFTTSDNPVYFAEEALKVAEEYKMEKLKTQAYYQLGEACYETSRTDSAIVYYSKILISINKKNQRDHYEKTLNRLSLCYSQKQLYDSAAWYNEAILKSFNETGQHGEKYYAELENYAVILSNNLQWKPAARICMQLIREWQPNDENLYDLSDTYELAGRCYFHLNKKDSASLLLQKSIELYSGYCNNFQKKNPGKIAPFISEERAYAFQYLRKILSEKNKVDELFQITELSKENLLYHLVTLKNLPETLVSLTDAQNSLPPDAAAISFSNGNDADAVCSIGFDKHVSRVFVHNHDQLQKEIQQQKFYNSLRHSLGSMVGEMNLAKKEKYTSFVARLIPLEYYMVISYYQLASRGIAIKKSYTDSSISSDEAKITISKLLYNFYIKPYEPLLKNKHTLYISADLMLNYIPFETLMDENGIYLGEKYAIVYVPSFTVQKEMEKRSYDTSGKLMAFGNAEYSSYHPEKLSGRAFDYANNGIKSWKELVGTDKELKMLSDILPGSQVIQGSGLSETTLKKMSSENILTNASILHFALHGMGSTVTGVEDNSLIVTEPDVGKEDGMLQFFEAYNLNIHPQLVCLSACETAFGTPKNDGSSSSMVTAFLAAGARSCIGTNWKISDDATMLFMKEFYTLVKQKVNFADALQRVRKKFISGEMGKEYQTPYYWAPFKLYGF